MEHGPSDLSLLISTEEAEHVRALGVAPREQGSSAAENWVLGGEAGLPFPSARCHGLHHACSASRGKRLPNPFGLFVCIPGLPQTQ